MIKIQKPIPSASFLISLLTIALFTLFVAAFVLEKEPTPIGNCYDPPNGCQ